MNGMEIRTKMINNNLLKYGLELSVYFIPFSRDQG